jgi:Tol biopolymer transport system component
LSRSGGEWKRLTEEKYWADKPRWSPDGKTLYFISNHRTAFNVWGMRFDPRRGDLNVAKAWLYREMSKEQGDES